LCALVLGFGIPFGIFFLLKMLDNTIKVKADLSRLSVPFLAEIPRSTTPKDGIIVEQGNRDMMNEAFRVLRTNMDLMLGKNGNARVVMFTSFYPNAGKTFTTMNTAASMALKGAKVIMVDLDLRKANLSKALKIEHTGVAAYLNGKVDDYHLGIQKITDTLDIIPVGTLPPNPTELLIAEKFQELINSLKKEYDYVFLDCPPIDLVADASIITEAADMTLFVMRANLMDKRILPIVEELYKSGKYSRMAMILNGVDVYYKKYGYGRPGYGYGYGYGYGNQE
jgi:capsular exopolysaccharide synthesis family protein